jgi:hypothetical protein
MGDTEMKRIALFFLIIMSISTVTPLANAVTDGCPSSWKIDSSISGGWKELMKAKEVRGSNMAIEVNESDMTYSDFSGEVGPVSKPTINVLGVPDLFLYSNTKVAIKISVQVKDCPGKTEFILQGGTLEEYFGFKINPVFIQTTAKDFAANKTDFFIDFVKAQEFPSCIERLTKLIISGTSGAISGASGGKLAYTQIDYGLDIPGKSFCNLARATSPILMHLTPGCSWIDNSNETPRRIGISVPPNKTCTIAFAFSSYPLINTLNANLGLGINPTEIKNPIYILESFTVSGPITKKSTITCIKGKLTKKVTAVNPKCPAGYKKK